MARNKKTDKMRSAAVLAVVTWLALAAAVAGEETDALVGLDDNGDLALQAAPGKKVVIEGVAWTQLMARLQALEDAVGLDPQNFI